MKPITHHPSSLYELRRTSLPLTTLRGVGAVVAKSLERLIGGQKIFDLLLHKPLRAEKILLCPRLFEVQNDELVIIKAKVESHVKPATPRQPFKVICYTPTGYVNLVFFKIFPSQLAKMKIGDEIAILGHLQKLGGENQITHPQEILPANQIEKLPQINVIYPLTAGITQRFLRQKIVEVLKKLDQKNDEWIDAELLKKRVWPSFGEALKKLHYVSSSNPNSSSLTQSVEDLVSHDSESKLMRSSAASQPRMTTLESARQRLAFDELLAWQIAVLLAKNKSEKKKNFSRPQENLTEKFLSQLPFAPTAAQLKAIAEINGEIFSHKKMLRLLQGDVGSGKTVVAITACLATISQKKQTCVIAPTTVLAKQHLAYFRRLLENFEISIEILTSATTKKQKAKILENLREGKIDVLISTHAVLEDDVKFQNLGLAVIDEQHRFGVIQRLKLVEKSADVDVLLMSATPIPRSLMMGLYGDMDISILGEKPQNRQKIETLVMSAKKTNELCEAMKRAVLRGEKIYWICPAIEGGEHLTDLSSTPQQVRGDNPDKNLSNLSPRTCCGVDDKNELATVKQKHADLTKIFDAKTVGLLHGKMKESEKEKIMAEFSDPRAAMQILVSTTVIEVGIDVQSATIIVIENAENFGLAQLHQLRGRVGRSDKKSFCILLYGEKYGPNQRNRLNILRESNDGFFIAEEDLKLRGSGELLGTKQSGFPEFRIADLSTDYDLVNVASKNAKLILHKELTQTHRKLLQLFGYDECLKLLQI